MYLGWIIDGLMAMLLGGLVTHMYLEYQGKSSPPCIQISSPVSPSGGEWWEDFPVSCNIEDRRRF